MQTLTIEVKDDFMIEFMKIIDNAKDNIIVKKDRNLEHDPYFYERQKELQQVLKILNLKWINLKKNLK